MVFDHIWLPTLAAASAVVFVICILIMIHEVRGKPISCCFFSLFSPLVKSAGSLEEGVGLKIICFTQTEIRAWILTWAFQELSLSCCFDPCITLKHQQKVMGIYWEYTNTAFHFSVYSTFPQGARGFIWTSHHCNPTPAHIWLPDSVKWNSDYSLSCGKCRGTLIC